ncbi:hypothetical protein FJT64_019424 [Amphibalanus amphitrite]|uniref:C2H2-type domain-containing protein n=1 Tax=Amphibalanus amphitrite TaxID=1232801 RepID=A0A6A4WW31_AMPAM|nr:hypothetical protein FJT64_019424 [Amphibalanus amphitrite]
MERPVPNLRGSSGGEFGAGGSRWPAGLYWYEPAAAQPPGQGAYRPGLAAQPPWPQQPAVAAPQQQPPPRLSRSTLTRRRRRALLQAEAAGLDAAETAALLQRTLCEERSYHCKQCNGKFDFRHSRYNGRIYCPEHAGGLTREQWRRDGGFRATCPLCDQTFFAKSSFRHHRAVHRGETTCPICHKVLSQKVGLKRHMALVHPKDD